MFRLLTARTLCLALFLGMGRVADVSAQARPITPGERVRFMPDTLELAVTGHYEGHSLPGLTRLEPRRSEGSKWLLGAGVGFLIGGGGTFAWLHSGGSTSRCDRSANQDAMSPGECVGLTLLGGIVGAGLGAAVGALVRD